MDIYQYMNSKDIRDYLVEIQYQFSPLEAAGMIYRSDHHTLEEKFEAWEELIRTTQDCEIPKRYNCHYRPSLHEFLKKYIAMMRKYIQQFMKTENGMVYQYQFYCPGDVDMCIDKGIYSSLDKCWENLQEDMDLDMYVIEIYKQRIDKDGITTAYYAKDGRLFALDPYWEDMTEEESDMLRYSFEGLWFDIPTPFKKGDIIVYCKDKMTPYVAAKIGPMVLDSIPTWTKREWIVENGDETDMMVCGGFADTEGNIYYESDCCYLDMEYFRGELKGTDRIMIALSNYLKDEIDMELLMWAQKTISLQTKSQEYLKYHLPDEQIAELVGLENKL